MPMLSSVLRTATSDGSEAQQRAGCGQSGACRLGVGVWSCLGVFLQVVGMIIMISYTYTPLPLALSYHTSQSPD